MLTLKSVLVLVLSLLAFSNAQSPGIYNYIDPSQGGGSMIAVAPNGLGEPLNIIISGESTLDVLTDVGFPNFAGALGFSTGCPDHASRKPISANLGDGNGWKNQTLELREVDANVVGGTCTESVVGSNHFSLFRQNGTKADSNALFLAVSEKEGHTIKPDGYNIGRDALVSRAVGTTSYRGVMYTTQVNNVTGLLVPGSAGLNQGISQDGLVVLLTVTIP